MSCKIHVALNTDGYIATSSNLVKPGRGSSVDEAIGDLIWKNKNLLGGKLS